MGNPFNFSQGIQGKSNDQVYNEQLSRLGQNDKARAEGLNQLAQSNLNSQLFGFKQDQYSNPDAGLTTEQQILKASLAGVDAATIGQARDNRTQVGVMGDGSNPFSAALFNSKKAAFEGAGADSTRNLFNGKVTTGVVDRQTANKSAFDIKQARGNAGKQDYSIEDSIAMNGRYTTTNEKGESTPSAYLLNIANAQGLDLPPEAIQAVHNLVSQGMAQRVPAAQIDVAVGKLLKAGISTATTDHWYGDNQALTYSPSAALGTQYALGNDGIVSGNDGTMYQRDANGNVFEVNPQGAQPLQQAQVQQVAATGDNYQSAPQQPQPQPAGFNGQFDPSQLGASQPAQQPNDSSGIIARMQQMKAAQLASGSPLAAESTAEYQRLQQRLAVLEQEQARQAQMQKANDR
ncbi:MAG: hypothetical protein R8M45_02190, partial [Ghiorsea sp.]